VVLEGSVRVGIDGASALDLGPGDMASMPKGSRIAWHPSSDCKVFWAYH
jgi:ethanolamine utilization protein EutQ (cupin superfamily)